MTTQNLASSLTVIETLIQNLNSQILTMSGGKNELQFGDDKLLIWKQLNKTLKSLEKARVILHKAEKV